MQSKAFLLPLLFSTSLASAGQNTPDTSSLITGIGISSTSSIYTGVDDEINAIPLLIYNHGNFYIRGPEVGYSHMLSPDIKITALARYRMGGYEASDSDHLAGMEDRDSTFELGLRASYQTQYGVWSLGSFGDVGDTHEGYELEVGWEKALSISPRWSITPAANISYQSDDLNRYYFGVRNHEATQNRAAYVAKGSTVYGLSINSDYAIDKKQRIRVGISYQSFGSEITDSSIVDEDSRTGINAIYMYRF